MTREGQMLHPSSKQAKGAIWESTGLILVSRTIIECVLLECIYGCMKKVIGNSAEKIVLFPIAFCDDMTSSVDEGSAVDLIYLAFSKALDSFQNILLPTVGCYGLDCWTNGCVNN